MFRKIFLVVVAVTAFAVVAGPAIAAKGGNSAAAKQCQKGGWENFVRADQTEFTSAEDCTSYTAQGGSLTAPTPPTPTTQTLCENANGTYNGTVEASRFFQGTNQFVCSGFGSDYDGAFAAALALQSECIARSGQITIYNAITSLGQPTAYEVACLTS